MGNQEMWGHNWILLSTSHTHYSFKSLSYRISYVRVAYEQTCCRLSWSWRGSRLWLTLSQTILRWAVLECIQGLDNYEPVSVQRESHQSLLFYYYCLLDFTSRCVFINICQWHFFFGDRHWLVSCNLNLPLTELGFSHRVLAQQLNGSRTSSKSLQCLACL